MWQVITGILSFIIAFLSKQDAVTFAAIIPLALFYYMPYQFNYPSLKEIYKQLFGNPNRYITLAGLSFIFFYISTRGLGAVLFVLSYLLTITFLILYHYQVRKKTPVTKQNKFSWIFILLGVVSFILEFYTPHSKFALLSLLLFALFFIPVSNNKKIKKIFTSSGWLPFLIPTVLLGLAAVIFHKMPNLYLPPEDKMLYHFENPQFVNSDGYSTWPVAFYSLFFYLKKLIWPHPLGFYYGYKMIPEVGWTSPEVLISAVFHIAILAYAVWKLPKKHILSFSILYYFTAISIFTNIVIQIPGIVGERMTYFPSLGFCIAITYIIFHFLKIDIRSAKIANSKITVLAVIILLILLPLSVKTVTRNKEWKNYLTLFYADIEYLANSAKANHTYAAQMLKEAYNNDLRNPPPQVQQKYLELAVKHLYRTIEIDSTHKFAWNSLGFVTFMYLNKEEEGIFYMNKSVEIDPEYERAHYNLGHAYKQIKQFDKSIAHLKKASEINPGESNYLSKLADVYLITGEYDQALQTDIKAIQVNPESELPYINLGNIYWMKTDTVKAIQNWEKAFELNPEHINLARNLAGYYSSINHSKADYYKSKIQELTSKPEN